MNVCIGDLHPIPCHIKASPVWALPRCVCLAADYVLRVAVFCHDINIMDGEEFLRVAGLFRAVAFLSIALVLAVLPWSASASLVWTLNRGLSFETA